MRVLVTGATGFIGRQAVEILKEKGHDVHAVSSKDANLLDAHERKRLMESVKPTHVLHFAWIATPGVYWTSPLNSDWQEATLDLLRLSKEMGVQKFVGAGSCAEYDWSSGHCDEFKTPLNPATPYGKAKAETAKAVIDASDDQLKTAWGRIFLLYGPHEHPKRLVSSVIISLLKNERAKCTHGKQIRDFMHVKDVADAFVSLLESDVTGPVNIASGNPMPIRDAVENIAWQLKKPDDIDFGAIDAPANDPPRLTASVNRLLGEVGWKPAFSLETGIADTIDWWKKN